MPFFAAHSRSDRRDPIEGRQFVLTGNHRPAGAATRRIFWKDALQNDGNFANISRLSELYAGTPRYFRLISDRF